MMMRYIRPQAASRLSTIVHNNVPIISTARASTHVPPPHLDEQGQVLGLFNYYNHPGTPALNDLTIIEGSSADNKAYRLPVQDLRSLPSPLSEYTHTKHGFQILQQPLPIDPSPASVHDIKTMKDKYYPAMIALLKDKLGVRSAIVRKHSLRDLPHFAPGDVKPEVGFEVPSLAPFSIAHADHTAGGARAHFRAMKQPDWFTETGTEDGCTTPAERADFFRLRKEIIAAEDHAIREAGLDPDANGGGKTSPLGGHWAWDGSNYKGPRYAYFSLWRSWEMVGRDPLAVMDMNAPTARDVEFVPLTRTYHHRPGCAEFFHSQNNLLRAPDFASGVTRGEGKGAGHHAWSYLSEQTPEEVYLITFYDSQALLPNKQGHESVQIACPHTAFHIDGTEHAPFRRSCELRVWCIW